MTSVNVSLIKQTIKRPNIIFTISKRIITQVLFVLLFHNLSYNLSLILKEYDKDKSEFNVNKKNRMRFYSACVGKLKFVDSCNMLKGSPSNLATHHILKKGKLTVVKETLQKYSTETQDLPCNTGKQFFPYEYMDSMGKLEETSLPPIGEFYSSLANSRISTSDYQHVQKGMG